MEVIEMLKNRRRGEERPRGKELERARERTICDIQMKIFGDKYEQQELILEKDIEEIK